MTDSIPLSHDWDAAIDLLLAFGRDRSDEGILRALADLASEQGTPMLPREQMLRLIHAKKEARK